jgi:GT2 family glycosyltransferase
LSDLVEHILERAGDLKLTIIIVSWNTKDILRQCLQSVYEQTRYLDFEVIVVDNASCDGSVAMVKREFPQVNLLENSDNKGFAVANNQAMAIAKGQYVLLLNSDTVILDNAIETTVDFADAHKDVAVVGPRVLNSDRTLQQTCFMFPSLLSMLLGSTYLNKLFPRSKFFGREQMTWWDRDDIREVDVVDGCFILVRREAVKQVGMLDERFFMYCEETDWCYRFRQAGWKVLFTSNAQIIHLGGQSSKQMPVEMSLQLRGSILQFMRKHRSVLEYKLACVLTWLFFAVRVPVWFVRHLVSKGRGDYCRMRMVTYLEGMKRLISKGGDGLCLKAGERGISV